MNTKPIVRAAVWTTWLGSVVFTKGLSAAAAPSLEKVVDTADGLINSVIGNWISNDLRIEEIDPGDLDTNGHLERLVALSIRGVIHNLPEHSEIAKAHEKTCRKLGKELEKLWPTLNILNRPVPEGAEIGNSESSTWISRGLDELSTEQIHHRVLDHAGNHKNRSVFSEEQWSKMIHVAWSDREKPLPADLIQACAEALHQHLAHYIYETTKLAAAKFPEAYAAVQLRILGEQTDLLRALHDHAGELSKWLGERFAEVLQAHATQTDQFSKSVSAHLETSKTLEAHATKLEVFRREHQERAYEISRLISTLGLQVQGSLDEIQADTAQISEVAETVSSIEISVAELKSQMAASPTHLEFLPPREHPPAAGKLFGREQDLKTLLPLLIEDRQIVISGPGGLGKTALMAELIEQFEASPHGKGETAGGVFKHDFYREPELENFISSILQQAGLHTEKEGSKLASHALAANVLRQPAVFLWIEGAEKLASLTDFQKIVGSSPWLIVTTRDPRHEEGFAPFALDPISEPASAAAIHWYAENYRRSTRAGKWAYGSELPAWTELGRALGGHPLACRIAGEQCGKLSLDPASFLADLKERGLQVFAKGDDSKHNLQILFRQSAATVAELLPGDPSPALRAWLLLSLGGTNPTPLSILKKFGLEQQSDLEPLLDLGLVWSSSVAAEEDGKMEPGFALSHALLAEWGRSELSDFGCPWEMALDAAMSWGAYYFEIVQQFERVPGGQARYEAISPLAETLCLQVKMRSDIAAEIADKFYFLPGRIHMLHANWMLSELYLREAKNMIEVSSSSESPIMATALNNLAALFQATNRLEEAEPMMRRASTIHENHYGIDHPGAASNLNNLAQLLQATNRLEGAESLMYRVMAIYEKHYGPMHPNVARASNNIAVLYQLTNRLGEAEPMMRRALAIDIKHFGKGHPNVATGLTNLAQLLQSTNRLEEAEPIMRRALAIDETNYGNDHPSVAADLTNLAQLLKATDRLGDAEPMMRRALAIDEKSYGKDHPDVATDLNNLARLLQATNRFEESEALMHRAIRISFAFTKHTNFAHPRLFPFVRNYLSILQDTGVEEDQLTDRILAVAEEAGLSKDSALELIKEALADSE